MCFANNNKNLKHQKTKKKHLELTANLKHLESVMNDELKLVFKYCTTNKLSINLTMTNYMVISSSRKGGHIHKIDRKSHIKSFCLRDRGRLGNEGQPILLKFGTQSRYVDLCNMPKF